MSNSTFNLKKIFLLIIVVISVSLLIEIFICNFRFWQSIGYTPADVEWNSTGMEKTENGRYKVTDPENSAIEFAGLDVHVDNVFADISCNDRYDDVYMVNIYMTDSGHAVYTKLSDTEIVPAVNESKYVRVHLQGKSEKIQIQIKNMTKDSVYDIAAGINVHRPFMFRWWRLLMIFVIIGSLVAFRPGSVIYSIPLNLKNLKQLAFVLVVLLLNIALFFGIAKVFWIKGWENNTTQMQYNYLAQSIIEGHEYLDFTPPKFLSEIDNPYDPALRSQAAAENNESYIIDFAYYNGHYYSYFGILPALLFFVPYIYITGAMLNTSVPIIIMTLLFIVAAFWFVETLSEKYFKDTSLGTYVFLSSILVAGSAMTYGVQFAILYSLPIVMGITLDILGITCWLRAVRNDGSISKVYLVVGAVCIAMVIGCRPQLAIVMILAFPIFWRQIKDRLFFSIKGIGNTCCVIIPFLIVGLGVMYYNYIRFGNPLDFGATYNLTGFDMTHRGIDFSRFGLGFFEYLLQPFNVSAKYPYLNLTSGHLSMVSDYQGQVINEPFFGGFFVFNVFGLFIIKIFDCKNILKKKGIWGFTILTLILATLIVALDIQMVGITFRYLTDFSAFMIGVSVIIVLALLDSSEIQQKKKTLKWVFILGVITIAVNYYTIIANGRYNSLINANPVIYYKIKYQLFSLLMSR